MDDPRLTAAITELKAASDLESQKAAFAALQEVHNEVLPFTVIANGDEYAIVDDSVHGLKATMLNVVMFDDAYVED
ncbi:hypothetical protein [uncultured Dietzia sp.]|uniref:hypothetical protein n=1 Tax=uncultured Dietzia sp. TaxID=395519 RepID=UPI0025D64F4E|nr:hypothetical protein [uncultured Dietzia sp.]